VKRFEARSCQRADIVFAAPNDQTELEGLGVAKDKFRTTYHLGDDSALAAPQLQYTDTRNTLMYVGTLSWPANSDGLLWFLREVWPGLKSAHADLHFDILGQGAGDDLKMAVDKLQDVQLHGFVEDLEPFYRKSRAFVAPLRFGSGTKVKVVTAMYRGIPCVTTSIGVEGISLVEGVDVHVCDGATSMHERIELLLTDRLAWESMRDASRQKALSDLSWDSMLENHARDLHVLAASRN
ncbi:MAG: glycosyltransferase family 4 protein, partial [Flavobacteriales bacterium]